MFVFYLAAGAAGLAVREQRLVAADGGKWYDIFRLYSNLIRFERVLSVRIWFRVFNIRNRSVFKCSKIIFLWCRYPLQFYPTKINTISIRLHIRLQIWKQIRYQWYPSVSDPFSSLLGPNSLVIFLNLLGLVSIEGVKFFK